MEYNLIQSIHNQFRSLAHFLYTRWALCFAILFSRCSLQDGKVPETFSLTLSQNILLYHLSISELPVLPLFDVVSLCFRTVHFGGVHFGKCYSQNVLCNEVSCVSGDTKALVVRFCKVLHARMEAPSVDKPAVF